MPRKAKSKNPKDLKSFPTDRQLILLEAYVGAQGENYGIMDDWLNNTDLMLENTGEQKRLNGVTASMCQQFCCDYGELREQIKRALAAKFAVGGSKTKITGKEYAEKLITALKDPEILQPEQLAALSDAINGNGGVVLPFMPAPCAHIVAFWDEKLRRFECNECHRVFYNQADLPFDRLGNLIHAAELGSPGIAELLAHLIAVLEQSPPFAARDKILAKIYPAYLLVMSYAPARNPNQVEIFSVPTHSTAHAPSAARPAEPEATAEAAPEPEAVAEPTAEETVPEVAEEPEGVNA